MTDQFDEIIKMIKKAMLTADCDASVVRAWLKLYEKVKKQTSATQESYIIARDNIEIVQKASMQMEEALTQLEWKSEKQDEMVQEAAKILTQKKGSYEHEFLVNKENQEYLLTYQTVLDLAKQTTDRIIFQSEVENLVALNQEILSRPTPHFYALGFYETNRSMENLSDLPYEEKMRKIESLYEADFIKPIRKQLISIINYADQLFTESEKLSGWRGNRRRETFSVFLNQEGQNKSSEERAEEMLACLK